MAIAINTIVPSVFLKPFTPFVISKSAHILKNTRLTMSREVLIPFEFAISDMTLNKNHAINGKFGTWPKTIFPSLSEQNAFTLVVNAM